MNKPRNERVNEVSERPKRSGLAKVFTPSTWGTHLSTQVSYPYTPHPTKPHSHYGFDIIGTLNRNIYAALGEPTKNCLRDRKVNKTKHDYWSCQVLDQPLSRTHTERDRHTSTASWSDKSNVFCRAESESILVNAHNGLEGSKIPEESFAYGRRKVFVYCFRRAIKLHGVVCSKPELAPELEPKPESESESKLDQCPATQLFTQYICVIAPSAQLPSDVILSWSMQAEDATPNRFSAPLSLCLSLGISPSLSALSNSWAWAYLCAWENILRWPQLKVTRLTATTKCTSIDFPDNTNHNKNIARRSARRRRRSRSR